MSNPSNRLLNIIQDERDLLEARIATYKRCFDLCQSPLEQLLLVTWLEMWVTDENYDPAGFPSVACEWPIEHGRVTLLIYPQYPVTLEGHNYRADFLLKAHLQCSNIEHLYAIEIDGHDFHERTKEQALRDKTRDRIFTRSSITVLRFTGQEIHRNVIGVISEIQETVRRGIAVGVLR